MDTNTLKSEHIQTPALGQDVQIASSTFNEGTEKDTLDKVSMEHGIRILTLSISREVMSYSPPSYPPSSVVPVTRTDTLTQIQEWLEDQRNSSSILWLYGPPKAGKSISAPATAELCHANNQLGGTFFFHRGGIEEDQTHFLFATLAYQLAYNIPGLLEPINRITCLDPTLSTKSMVTQFQSLIVEAFAQYTPSPTAPIPIIILDRLDECPNEESQLEILHIIGRSTAELKLPLRYIITSRPEPHLREAFKKDPLYQVTRIISIGDQYDSTNLDPSSRPDPQQEHHPLPSLHRPVHSPLERQHIHYRRPYSIRDFPQPVSVQGSNGNAEAYSRSPLLSGNGFPVQFPGGDPGKSVEYLPKGLSPGDAGLSKAMSEQPWVGGQPAASSDSQSRSGHKEKESLRSSAQQSFDRQDARVRGDYVTCGQGLVGSYRGEAGGGLLGHPSDSQSRSGNKEESSPFSMQPSSSRPDPRGRADTNFVVGSYRGGVGGGISGYPSDSQSRSGNKGKKSSRSLGQPSSSRSDPRFGETDADYGTDGQDLVGGYRGEASGGASGQPQPWTGEFASAFALSSAKQPSGRQPGYTSCGSSRTPYPEQDNRGLTFPTSMMGTTEHSSRSPPNLTTSQRQEDSPPYNTQRSGLRSGKPADPSRTTLYGAFPQSRPPQHEAQYSHSSQVRRSVGSQRPGNPWDGGSSRPSSSRDSSSNPSAGATGSHPWSGQPAGAPPGWFAHSPHPDSILPPFIRATQQTSRHGSAGEDLEGDKTPPIWSYLWLKKSLSEARSFPTTSTHSGIQRRLTDIVEGQEYSPSQQALPYNSLKIQALGTPFLSPFLKGKDSENLGLSQDGDGHILLYMRSNIIDTDTIAFWFPAPTLFPPSGGRRGVQLGDLGYFDDSGEFHPIFNIFHSYEENIAEGARPPSQPYQHVRIDRNSIRQVDIQRQQTYTSSNIEKRGEGGPHSQNSYQFRTYKQSGRSGAIIVLPHGGSSSCIRNAYFRLPEVKQHFREHAPSWYQHALQYIPKQTNGSLILVRATYCARSWGIAAFASKRDIREPLTATFMPNPTYEYQHMWQTNDSTWKTSTGPSSEELRELAGGEPPLNQCIGVVISSLRLDDTTWQANFGRLSSSSRRGGGWGLHRVMSRDSRSTIHVDNSGKRRLLDFIFRRPTEIRHASYGSDDYTLLPQRP